MQDLEGMRLGTSCDGRLITVSLKHSAWFTFALTADQAAELITELCRVNMRAREERERKEESVAHGESI